MRKEKSSSTFYERGKKNLAIRTFAYRKRRNVEIERILWGKIVVSVGWPLADMTRSEWNLHSAT